MPYLSLDVGELETNCYLFHEEAGRECLVIDPGAEAERIMALIEERALLPRAVVLTHGHPDHAGAAATLMDHYRIPLWLHAADEELMRSEAGRALAAMFGVGPLPAAGLIGTAHPLFTRSKAAAPLRRRGGDTSDDSANGKREREK